MGCTAFFHATSWVEVHGGAHGNREGLEPPACARLQAAAMLVTPDAIVWRGDRNLPDEEQGIIILGTPVGKPEYILHKLTRARSTWANFDLGHHLYLGQFYLGQVRLRFRCSGVQVFRCSGVQVFRCSGVWVFGCLGVWVFGCSGVQVFRCSSVQVLRCSGVQVFRCSGVQVFRSLGLWVFGSLGLWVFGSLGLWVFGSLGLWVFGSLGL